MIVFLDVEVSLDSKKIVDYGCLRENGDSFHTASVSEFIKFTKKADIFVGHNIIFHDVKYLQKVLPRNYIKEINCVDTLFLSTLLFPENPYHALLKDDKTDSDDANNPLNDSIKAKLLFDDEVSTFEKLDNDIQEIYYNLLWNQPGFAAFFKYIKFDRKLKNLAEVIKSKYYNLICSNTDLDNVIKNSPIELAYCLALIRTKKLNSLMPGWVLVNYPQVEEIMTQLRNTPCAIGCSYCNQKLNAITELNRFFDYPNFKEYNGIPLQEKAVKAAMEGKSLIAVFPTGGGKSLTYQLPALISRESTRGLTVVISPLQSLMKDQVDNLESKNINASVTINGLLDPLARKTAIERVENGSAGILYIAPESLRSKTIERLLVHRHVVRFVIDEAHCFSAWGQDFRVDYLYIADFIKNIQNIKGNRSPIPVSCFTATAKQNVIKDIEDYFRKKLGISMLLFEASGKRENLHYKVYDLKTEDDKYKLMRNLIDQENCPSIVYASRRKTVEEIYERLLNDNYKVSRFHGGMQSEEKESEQNKFMSGESTIMIATSAFGMGVDKKDVGCVIHYEISSSLEDYVQESGRAGRDQDIFANCYILYQEDDLNKHFNLLNQSKITVKEIQQVWKGIKDLSKIQNNISHSALEIAKAAGWDDSIYDLQTRVTTAVAVLEQSGYLKRGQNSPKVYANSILSRSVIDARKIIESSEIVPKDDIDNTVRVFSKLISAKSNKYSNEEIPEVRIDYISEHLGIQKNEVVRLVNYLRELKILDDAKDLSAYFRRTSKQNIANKILLSYIELIKNIINDFSTDWQIYNVKEINERNSGDNVESNLRKIKNTINFLEIENYIEIQKLEKDYLKIRLKKQIEDTVFSLEHMWSISSVILTYFDLISKDKIREDIEYIGVNFSVIELRDYYETNKSLLDTKSTLDEIEDSLLFLHKIEAIKLQGGFFVLYSPMKIDRIEMDNRKQYTKADYEKLDQYYKSKMQQIHIVGEYANKMIENYQSALKFVDDYFKLDYKEFLNKYFVGQRKKDIENNMSPKKFKELFGSLSPEQIQVIQEKEHSNVIVAAGPGSGKTRVLVHKLASILYTEDIRHEQLLMLTFSRAAVTEFKERLKKLIHSSANYIDIKTFHSFCFDVLGRVGSLEKTDEIINQTIQQIRDNEVDPSRITKMVLVIDEAQDIDLAEFNLIQELISFNENLRIIAVGDDDQNIYQFRGASSEYLMKLNDEDGVLIELSTNYRSKNNLVDYTNTFVSRISNRIKRNTIKAKTSENGNISMTKYSSPNFMDAIIQKYNLLNESGTTCILTRTNDEATSILGLLNYNNIPAQLIQNNDDFNLYNLVELRYFVDLLRTDKLIVVITDELWKEALENFRVKYESSGDYSFSLMLLNKFYSTTTGKFYISDLIDFINDSNFSDFLAESQVYVSTLHKAKGKEFENVQLIYTNTKYVDDNEKRLLYVGMTRAKNNLHIHYTGNFFDQFISDHVEYKYDSEEYEIPPRLLIQMSMKDINLGYFKYVQSSNSNLVSGQEVQLSDEKTISVNGRKILQFSKGFSLKFEEIQKMGYQVANIYIKHRMFWYDKEEEKEYLVCLPEIVFNYDPITEVNNTDESIVSD
ncbi:MAG: RecQ family ATP-dependent DNA helicase [Candidatus Izemoplasmatales bacterium]